MNNHRTIAVIPVYGRGQLVKRTIERLLTINGCSEVICVGDLKTDEAVCRSAGAKWVTYPNYILGAKWNAGFRAAQHYNPDSCLFVGSSDWLSRYWLPTLQEQLKHRDMVGRLDCYFMDWRQPQGYRCLHWPGYYKQRHGETIGIGRLLSARILDKLNWQPFDKEMNHSMDYTMVERVKNAGGQMVANHSPEVVSLSISCEWWANKHNFDNERLHPHAKDIDPFEFMEQWGFEDLREIFG